MCKLFDITLNGTYANLSWKWNEGPKCNGMQASSVPINSYGHVGKVASDFAGLLPDIDMNYTQSSAIYGIIFSPRSDG